MGTTTEIIAEHSNDYFVAHVDNGSVRIGLLDVFAIDYAPSSAEYQNVINAANDADLVEEMADEAYIQNISK